MARPLTEWDLQHAHFQWLVGWPDKNGIPTKKPALIPGVECWHTPNGGERRNAFEGMRLKQIGVQAGIHDLFYLRPTDFGAFGRWGLLFGQEWKKPGGVLSPAQKKMHPRLVTAGLAAFQVVDNLADAREWCFAQGLALPVA